MAFHDASMYIHKQTSMLFLYMEYTFYISMYTLFSCHKPNYLDNIASVMHLNNFTQSFWRVIIKHISMKTLEILLLELLSECISAILLNKVKSLFSEIKILQYSKEFINYFV